MVSIAQQGREIDKTKRICYSKHTVMPEIDASHEQPPRLTSKWLMKAMAEMCLKHGTFSTTNNPDDGYLFTIDGDIPPMKKYGATEVQYRVVDKSSPHAGEENNFLVVSFADDYLVKETMYSDIDGETVASQTMKLQAGVATNVERSDQHLLGREQLEEAFRHFQDGTDSDDLIIRAASDRLRLTFQTDVTPSAEDELKVVDLMASLKRWYTA